MHPIENALIVHCEAEVSVVNDDLDSGNCLVEKSKVFDKVIRLHSFNQDTDIDQLCKDVIAQSEKLILSSQEDEVKKLLNYLKNRKSLPTKTMQGSEIENFRPKTANSITHSNSTSFISKTQTTNRISYSASSQSFSSIQELIDYQTFFKQIENDFKESETIGLHYKDKVSITELQKYFDLLYEEDSGKLEGAVKIFRLSLENENLLSLTTNEELLKALSRIFREENRKSNDVSSLILAFFCSISFFKEFHSIITDNKVGITSIDLINLLFEKESTLYQQLKINDQQANKLDNQDENKSDKLDSESVNINQLMISRKKFEIFQRKNNRLLQLSFFLLLNLSSDTKTEYKIFNKNIITHLINSLKRPNLNLEMQLIILTFLQRLSIKLECKNQMISLGIVPIIYALLNNIVNQVSYYSILTNPLFKLIFNLSFDLKCRTQMIKQGYIHKLIQILIKSRFKNEKLLISIFYQFTLEKKYRNLFIITLSTGKNLINLFVNRTFQIGDKLNQNLAYEFLLDNDHCFTEYACLMINLSMDKDCAQMICENNALEKLLSKAFNEDLNEKNCNFINICYMKILRNVTIHEHPYKMLFLDGYHELLIRLLINENISNSGFASKSDSNESNNLEIFTIQALNILANLQKVNWLQLVEKYALYDWMKKRIKVGSNFNNEIIIGCLCVLESCFSQKECAVQLIETDFISLLIDLLNAKQEEDDMVMQILYVINSMSNHEQVCNYLIKNDQIIIYLLDLINDKNNHVKCICNFTLDLISEYDDDLKMRLKEERFKSFNKSWLEMINTNENVHIPDDQKGEEQLFNSDLFAEQHLFSLENLNEEELINERFEATKSRYRSSRPQTAVAKHRGKSAKSNF